MFINNINPDLMNIGPFSIRFYGIVYAVGFLVVYYLLLKAAEKKTIKNLDKDKASDLAVYTMLSGILGARIFHVIADFHLYKDNLLGIFEIWNGGLGFYGGLAGGVLAIFFYCRKHKVDISGVIDTMALPLPLIITFGRIANYMNSEHIGSVSDLPWCVVFQKIDTVCRHPAQIYEAISMFIVFLLLIAAYKLWRKQRGAITWVFIMGYGIARFTTDYFRETQSAYFFGLAHTQIISLIMAAIGAYFLYKTISSSPPKSRK